MFDGRHVHMSPQVAARHSSPASFLQLSAWDTHPVDDEFSVKFVALWSIFFWLDTITLVNRIRNEMSATQKSALDLFFLFFFFFFFFFFIL